MFTKRELSGGLAFNKAEKSPLTRFPSYSTRVDDLAAFVAGWRRPAIASGSPGL